MNRRGQFSIIAALLVAVVLVTTVIVTYSVIRDSPAQGQPQIMSAVDETNLAIKQVLGFTVGYYGSVLQVTGNSSYAKMLATNYLQSGFMNIANTHPEQGASFNLSIEDVTTFWFTGESYSTGRLVVNYDLTSLGIYGITYETSCRLMTQIENTTSSGQAKITVTKDEGEPLANLAKENFMFYVYSRANSNWTMTNPLDEPLAFANGTYLIDVPPGTDPYSYVVEVQDSRGIVVVGSSFGSLVYAFDFSAANFTAGNVTVPNSAWWNPSYQYRKLVTITNNAGSSVSAGYSALVTLDTASLVSAGKMLASGSDLRIVHWNGFSWVELDRDVINKNSGATQVWFKTQASIGASPSSDNDYYLYYGNPLAGNPPANKSNVYLWFDDFNRLDEPDVTAEPAYTKTNGGIWSIENGSLKNVGGNGDPNKLIVNTLGSLNADVDIFIKMNVAQWAGDGDAARMGLSSCMDSSGAGYCALFHNDRNSLDLLNDLRSWGTHTAYSWSTSAWYYMRFRVINPGLNDGKVKVWPVGMSEPSSWTVDGIFGGGSTRGQGWVGIAGSGQGDTTNFNDLCIRYIVDPEPSVLAGQEETPPGLPRPAHTHLVDTTIVTELLQDGTTRCLGQNLNMVTQAKPIPPIPVKAIHVNQTVSGISSEVPFQIEDWTSEYKIPLGLTNNASLFNSRTMLVFLATFDVSKVTIWWDGHDNASQTPYGYVNHWFADNPAARVLRNSVLTLQFGGGFTVTSTMGGSTCTANFMRINNQASSYGSDLSYVITNGVVRDIVQQEAEWGGGVNNCPNLYAHIVLTLPARTTYYTYQLRLMFAQSQQNRSISDLCPIKLAVSVGQPQTENGTVGGLPIVSNSSGLFYNSSSSTWQHHWSQFIQGKTGAGIMFTDQANQMLYVFDTFGNATGALRVNAAANTIELLPIAMSQVQFNYAFDAIWQGAVVSFDNSTPIYYKDGTGLWATVEYPPAVTVSTEN
jgi:hypothetical protein